MQNPFVVRNMSLLSAFFPSCYGPHRNVVVEPVTSAFAPSCVSEEMLNISFRGRDYFLMIALAGFFGSL